MLFHPTGLRSTRCIYLHNHAITSKTGTWVHNARLRQFHTYWFRMFFRPNRLRLWFFGRARAWSYSTTNNVVVPYYSLFDSRQGVLAYHQSALNRGIHYTAKPNNYAIQIICYSVIPLFRYSTIYALPLVL